MKNLVLIILGFHLSVAAFTQIISGVVLDGQTNDTIPFASIYFNGTFVGTSTDNHGRFAIDLTGHKSMPLTISAIGYNSLTLSEFPASKIVVLLEPKVYQMKPAVITGESLLRERDANMKIFKREFLGTSAYARKSIILNEKDITFNYGENTDTLKAYAKSVLHIYNPLLGYKMACFLDEFNFNKVNSNVFINGFILFEQDLIDSTGIHKTLKRRRHAYLGSPMHFFRSLYANNLQKEGFSGSYELNFFKGKALYKQTVIETESIKYFGFSGNLSISYNNNLTDVKFLSSPVAFNQTGQYDFTKISLKGKMADYRVGDWLPIEYKP